MKLKTLLAVLLLALAAGCGGGGGGSNTPAPSASEAFVASVRTVANSSADEAEPLDVSGTPEASDDDVEPSAI